MPLDKNEQAREQQEWNDCATDALDAAAELHDVIDDLSDTVKEVLGEES